MVCIASIAAHDSARLERLGLRRALLTRRANLGDCPDARSVLRHVASPRALRHPACVVPLPRRVRGDLSTAELAMRVSRQAIAQLAQFDPQSVGALIYCHATPDARTTDSTAGQLQCELNLRRACAFSVSQAHNTAPLIALDMAIGLIEGPEASPAVLLVAADKLLFSGRPPHPACEMVWSDVAAAALLTRDATAGWRVDALRLGHFPASVGATQAWTPDEVSAFAGYAAHQLAEGLSLAGVAARDLAAVVTASGDPGFVARVHRGAGVAGTAQAGNARGLRRRHAACADVLARLAGLEGRVAPGRAVLGWSHGHNGEFACIVTTRIG